ncbi:hypothetical protein [Leuconostoc lactis]|uniref:hypothetical protein n=1 Tax=Leuconostoc lactis TaxID=1246 RepID=UPI0031D39BA9
MAAGGTFYSNSANELDNVLNGMIRSIRNLDKTNSEKPLLEDILKKLISPENTSSENSFTVSEKDLLIRIIEHRMQVYSLNFDRFHSQLDSFIIFIGNLNVPDLTRLSNSLSLIELQDPDVQTKVTNLVKKIDNLITKKTKTLM